MTWEHWVIIYKTVEYSVSFLTVVIGILSIVFFKRNTLHYKLLCYYFVINAFVDLIGWCVYYFKFFEFSYMNSLNHLLIISETLLIGSFFLKLLNTKVKKYIIIGLMTAVIGFDLYSVLTHSINENTKYNSALLSGLLCLAGLITFHEVYLNKFSKKISVQPDIIIVGSFIFIYMFLVIIFFLMPSMIEYSQLGATQLVIFKNILIIICLLGILRGMWLKINLTPIASLKP